MKQDLIRKIKQLKDIQPSQEWLNSTRHNLTVRVDFDQKADSKAGIGLFYWLRQGQSVALTVCLLLIFFLGPWLVVKASQASLPGEFLYPIKRMTEDFQASIASKNNKAQLQAEFASRRLDELTKITEDSFTPDEKTQRAKQVVDDLKNNLAGVSVHLGDISKEKAIAVAKKAQTIKKNLDKTKEEAPLDVQDDLAEAEKAVEEINDQILSVLVDEDVPGTATSTSDQEILIFLEETEEGTVTTTDKIINGNGPEE